MNITWPVSWLAGGERRTTQQISAPCGRHHSAPHETPYQGQHARVLSPAAEIRGRAEMRKRANVLACILVADFRRHTHSPRTCPWTMTGGRIHASTSAHMSNALARKRACGKPRSRRPVDWKVPPSSVNMRSACRRKVALHDVFLIGRCSLHMRIIFLSDHSSACMRDIFVNGYILMTLWVYKRSSPALHSIDVL